MKPSRGLDAFPFPISSLIFYTRSYRQATWQDLVSGRDALFYVQYDAHYWLAVMTAIPPRLPRTSSGSGRVALRALIVTLICATIGGWCGWVWISDPNGFDGEGGGMALLTFYFCAAITVVVAAVVSGGLGCGIFFAGRGLIRRRRLYASDRDSQQST
jgi:hypothetical protein